MEREDEDLIRSYQQGDTSALSELFGRYKRPIFNFSLRLLNNRADAEDVTSEVFMKLCEKKHLYQPMAAKFSTWLFTIAYNESISKMRSRRGQISLWLTRPNGEEAQWDVPSTQTLAPEEMIQKEQTQQVRHAITKLPALQKEAIILREYDGFSYQEISKIMNCSLEQVKILIFRAREFLRQQLPVTTEGQDA